MSHCLKSTVAGREFTVSWQGLEAGGGRALVPQPRVAGTSSSMGGRYKKRPAEKHPDRQHEHVSWAVEESNVEKGAWSGTF